MLMRSVRAVDRRHRYDRPGEYSIGRGCKMYIAHGRFGIVSSGAECSPADKIIGLDDEQGAPRSELRSLRDQRLQNGRLRGLAADIGDRVADGAEIRRTALLPFHLFGFGEGCGGKLGALVSCESEVLGDGARKSLVKRLRAGIKARGIGFEDLGQPLLQLGGLLPHLSAKTFEIILEFRP